MTGNATVDRAIEKMLENMGLGNRYRQTAEERLAIEVERCNHYVAQMVGYQRMYWEAAGFPMRRLK